MCSGVLFSECIALRTRRFYNGTGILLSHHSLETGSNIRCCWYELFLCHISCKKNPVSTSWLAYRHDGASTIEYIFVENYTKIKGVESISQDN